MFTKNVKETLNHNQQAMMVDPTLFTDWGDKYLEKTAFLLTRRTLC